MTVLTLAIACYLSAMLGVSGLAKVEHPNLFAATLARHRLLPRWAIHPVSLVLPWAEILLALLLVTGWLALAVSVAACLLFLVFGAVEATLVLTDRASECGCFGLAYRQRVDGASVAVSGILASLAALEAAALTSSILVPPAWRAAATAVLLVGAGWLVLRMVQRWRRRTRPPRLMLRRRLPA